MSSHFLLEGNHSAEDAAVFNGLIALAQAASGNAVTGEISLGDVIGNRRKSEN